MRFVFTVQKGDRAAKISGPTGQDGMARSEEQHCVDDEQADWIDEDGCPRERERIVMRLSIALDGHIRLEPLALCELVARECFKGHVCNKRVRKEGELQEGGSSLFQPCPCCICSVATYTDEGNQHYERCQGDGCHHVQEECIDIATHIQALEYAADARKTQAHSDREDAH